MAAFHCGEMKCVRAMWAPGTDEKGLMALRKELGGTDTLLVIINL